MDVKESDIAEVVELFYSADKALENDPDLSRDKLEILKEWAATCDGIFQGMTDIQFLLFLQSCYGDVEKTKICMSRYFESVIDTPQFFERWDTSREHIKQGLDVAFYAPLPKLSPKNYLMVMCRYRDSDASKYVFTDGTRLFMMTVEAQLLTRGPQEGLVVIMDMTNMTFGHIWRFPMALVKKFIHMVQDGMPVRLKEIHVVNCRAFLPTLMAFIKPLMKKELAELINFHSGAMEDFRSQFPEDCLPAELGGKCGALLQHHENNIELLTKLAPLWKAKDAWSINKREELREKE